MKILKSIAVIILLFGLPAGSWYFLQQGLDWRKEKEVALKNKVRFLNAYNFSNSDKDRLFETMSHKTSVVKLENDISDLDKELMNQFRNAFTFQFVVLSDGVKVPEILSSKDVRKYYDPQNQEATVNELKNAQYLLVDTVGYIRQYYNSDKLQTMNRLVEDVALILPKVKTRDILMKRKGNE